MDSSNEKDPRNALASWDGYEFQGQIALIVVLEMIIARKFSTEKCELMLEDLEDFSIYYMGKRISTHQVKATKDKKINDYKEALYKMAVGLQRGDRSKETKAYLHTSNYLNTENWVEDLKVAIEGFVPETVKKLNKCITDDNELEKKVKGLKERYRKNGSFKTKRMGIWEEIYRSMDDVAQEAEIVEENLKNAIVQYLDKLPKVDLLEDNLLNRILYYEYSNHVNVDRKSTRERIEELIREYWGNETAELRKGDECRYRYVLQEIIRCYVIENHEGNIHGGRIQFNEIIHILDGKSLGSREYKILRNKDIFYEKLEEYCEDVCGDKKCEQCDLFKKIEWFKKLSNQELETVFHLMSPHVNKVLDEDSNIVKEDGLMDSFFYTLNNMEVAKIIHNAKIVYQKGEKNCLLTDIQVSRNGKKGILRGLVDNDTLDEICSKIMNNREFAKERMEIDTLIVSNQGGENIRIDEMCRKLLESTRESDEWSYLRITQKKDVSMVDADKFIEEYK